MMTQAEAKRIIFAEWIRWRDAHDGANTHSDRMSFWMDLEHERPDLRFRCRGDSWQYVQGWLNEEFGLADNPADRAARARRAVR